MSTSQESNVSRRAAHESSAEPASRESGPGKQARTDADTAATPSLAVQRKAPGAPPAGAAERAGDWAMSDGMLSAMGLSAVQAYGGDVGGGLGGADAVATAERGVASASSPLPYLDTIQQSFGRHDVSGVRAQVGGDAAGASRELGAQAYAVGDRVAFAGSPDLHTAAHEAAHVVQQASGGVQLKGGVGQAGDVHEQHADAVADAVVAGKSAEGLLDQYASGPAISVGGAAGAQKKAVQRKLGFEFEAQGDGAWRFQARNNPQEHWAGINHTKEIILKTPSGKAGFGADTGRIEVITRPLSSWAEVVATFAEIQAMMGRFAGGEIELTGAENAAAAAVTGMAHHKIVAKGVFVAKPQATFGMAPINTEKLFNRVMQMHENPQDTEEQNIGTKILANGMAESISDAKNMLTRALQAAHKQPREYEGLVQEEMAGALMLICKAMRDAFSNSGPGLTDPKYAFPMMPRTDYRSMLRSLEPGSKDLLIELWGGGAGPLATEIDNIYDLNEHVFTYGYKGENKKKQKGPTIGAWLSSIFNGNDPKDLISPPAGYPAHATTPRPEGLGAYGTDGHLALYELRDIMGEKPIPFAAWLPLARKVAEVVSQVEQDDALRPQ